MRGHGMENGKLEQWEAATTTAGHVAHPLHVHFHSRAGDRTSAGARPFRCACVVWQRVVSWGAARMAERQGGEPPHTEKAARVVGLQSLHVGLSRNRSQVLPRRAWTIIATTDTCRHLVRDGAGAAESASVI